jgi:TP901 family phage tail tape measure protein
VGLRLELRIDDKGTATVKRVEGAHKALERTVIRGSALMSRAVNGLRRRWQAAQASLSRFAMIAKLALAGLAVAAIVTGAKFEQSMANVAAVSSSTAEQLEKLTAVARGLGATTAFSASQAADAMFSLAQAGQSVAQIQKSVGSVLLFAGAAATDLAGSAEILVQTLAQFGLEASSSDRVVNVFAASMTKSLLNAERLREGLSQVGSTASAVGLGLEETISILGALNNAGQLGGIAGTRLKNVLVRLAAPNAVLKELLGGVTLATDGLGASMNALKNADPGKIFKAFGRIAAPAVLVLRRQVEATKELEKAITGTQKAQEMFKTQMATVSSQFRIFKSQLQENMIATFFALRDSGFSVLEGLTSLLKRIKPIIVGVTVAIVRWFRENSELVASLGKALVVLGAVGAVVAILSSGIGLTITLVAAAVVAWGKWGDAIKNWFGGVVDSVIGFARAFWESQGSTIKMVLGFWKNFTNGLIGLFVFLGLEVRDAATDIRDAFKTPIQWIIDRLTELIEFAGPLLKKLGVAFGKAFEWIKEKVAGEMDKTQEHLEKNNARTVENARQAFGTDYVGAVVGGITKAGADAGAKLEELAAKAKSVMSSTIANIKATGEAASGQVLAPGAATAAEVDILDVKPRDNRDAEIAAEIKAGQVLEDQRRASLVRAIGTEKTFTEEWLAARLEMIRTNYDEEASAAGESQEKLAEIEIERAAAVAEARIEHDNAVRENFLLNNEIVLIGLQSLEAGYDTFFAGVARGEINTARLRKSLINSVRTTFIKNTADMVKHHIKSWIKGLLVTRVAKEAEHKSSKLEGAKEGAVKAYSAFAGIPIIGPALGAAAAAAAFAFLMAFAQGGPVPGASTGRDSVPSLLTPEEYVIRRDSARSIGQDNLDFINRTGALPPNAGGGGDVFLDFTVEGGSDADMEEYLEDEVLPTLRDMNQRRRGFSRRTA